MKTMQMGDVNEIRNTMARTLVEGLGMYGSALEHGLRVNKALVEGGEKAVKTHIELADAMVAQIQTLLGVEDLKDLPAAQQKMVQEMNEEVANSARSLLKIQRETGADVKALVEESVKTFTPEAVTRFVPKAA